MYIGSLTKVEAGLNITYAYYKRGMQMPCAPDFLKEEVQKEKYDVTGRLFTEQVGYLGQVLLHNSVDIRVDFGQECYVDHILFEQRKDSQMGEVTVLKQVGTACQAIGLLKLQSSQNMTDTEINIPVGVYTDHFILRIKGVCKNIILGKLDVYGAVNLQDAIYPFPKEIIEKAGYLEKLTGIVADGEAAIFAAENFIEKFSVKQSQEKSGESLGFSEHGNISFALADMEEEAFTIIVTEEEAIVKGGSLRALLYASEKLLQLCTPSGIRCAEIYDAPFMELRGVHFALPDRKQIPFVERMVKYVFMPMGYNTVFLQMAGAMEYKKHPLINEKWVEACKKYEAGEWPCPAHYHFMGHDILAQEEVRELCAYMRSYGMEIVPEVQTFGHVQYITQAYPELGELEVDRPKEYDLAIEDARPEEFYIHSMCPNHPDYYKITFDIIDEVIEVVQPERYLHIGHDEIYTIAGDCERCRDKTPEEIYVTEVTRLHEHIKEKGLRTMMWSDMIQEANYATHTAIDKLPKDILCLSFTWYFHLDEDVEDMLYDHGYDVVIGNMYSSHYRRYDKRKYGKTLIGGEVSTWVPCNELYYGFEGKTYEFLFTSNMLWSEAYCQNMRLTYDEILQSITRRVRGQIGNQVMPEHTQKYDFAAQPQKVPVDILKDYEKAEAVGMGEEVRIPFYKKAERISFLQATDLCAERVMWQAPQKIGSYRIQYADGTEAEAEILYAANICEYKRRYAQPIASDFFKHEGYFATCTTDPVMGKTIEGEDYTLYHYTWVNPNPEKEISDIVLKHSGVTDAKILLFEINYA